MQLASLGFSTKYPIIFTVTIADKIIYKTKFMYTANFRCMRFEFELEIIN